MSKVSWTQIGLVSLGILSMLVGSWLSVPALLYAGLGLIGLGFGVGGGEAIVTRRFLLQRRGFSDVTYRGLSAMFYGIIFVWIGFALLAVATVLFLGVGEAVLRSFVRRPGFVLVSVALFVLAWSGVVVIGPMEARPGSKAGQLLELISVVLRLIPGLILVLLGLAVLGLGVVEILAPATFDQVGGGFLEVLFGRARP